MGLFGRKTCARCRTPLRAGSPVCPYCGFDPAAPAPARRKPRAQPLPPPDDIADDAPRRDAPRDDDLAPEAAPWRAPEASEGAEPWKTAPDKPAPSPQSGPWQTRAEAPVADELGAPWDEVRAPAGGPWAPADPEDTALERMVRDNPKLNPAKKPNRVAWAVAAFILVMVVRFVFGA